MKILSAFMTSDRSPNSVAQAKLSSVNLGVILLFLAKIELIMKSPITIYEVG